MRSALNLFATTATLAPMSGDTPDNAAANPLEAWLTPRRFAVALAFALVAGFFPVATGGRSFFFFDYGVLGYPFAFHHQEQFWAGNWFPLWNPLSNSGAPFLAQWGTMALYPGSLLYLLLPLPWSLGAFCLLHLFFAGLGMHHLARAWWGSGLGAAVAGFGFVFGGAALASLIWPNYTVALGWMPWVILLAERAWREGGGRRIAVAALAGGMQMMSGVPEIVLFTWGIVGAAGVLAVLRREAPIRQIALRVSAVVFLVSALSLAQLLPFIDLLGVSQRHAGFATAKWSLPLWGWANLLVPLFHNFRNVQGYFIQQDQYFLMSYYSGLGVVCFAVFGVAGLRNARAVLLAALAVLALVLAWGEGGYVYSWLRSAIPYLGVGRYPVKFLFVTAFVLPLLSAAGVRWLESKAIRNGATPPPRMLWWVPSIVAVIAAAVVWRGLNAPVPYEQPSATAENAIVRLIFLAAALSAAWLSVRTAEFAKARAFGLILLAVLCVDGLTHKPGLNPTLLSQVFDPGLAKLDAKPAIGEARVFISPAAEAALLRSTVTDPHADLLGKRLALWSNLNLLEGVPKVNGSSTLQLRWQREVQDLLYATNATELPALLDFLGVSLVTAPGKVVEWAPRAGAMPWITIGQAPQFADPPATLSAWRSAIFNPRETVYLPREAEGAVTAKRNPDARVVSQRFGPERIDVKVETTQPALLVVAQSFHAPWKAVVDGNPAPLFRANHAFQAVELPAGAREVALIYEDNSFRAGAAVSLAALLACLLLFVRGR